MNSNVRGLYAIIDPVACAGRSALGVAEAVVAGGCAVLQLRDKRADDAGYLALGRELRALCTRVAIPFVVNDRVHLAHELRADGVHVGQGDMSIAEARTLLGRDVLVGVSTHSLAQALRARDQSADLIGFGPVYPTRSKENADPVVGEAELERVCHAVMRADGTRLPVVAIGGVTAERAAALVRAGATFAAAISAICEAPDPEHAARALHTALLAAPKLD